MARKYKSLSAADRLNIASQRRHQIENDHYNVSLSAEPARDERLNEYEETLNALDAEIAALEAEVKKQPKE